MSGAKFLFHKTSADRSKRPPGNCLRSLLLLLCWFEGADLFFLVISLITFLVRHVRVFNLWGCTRTLLFQGHFHKTADIYAFWFLIFTNVYHCNSLPMRCSPLTLTGPPPAFSLMVTGAFSSNSPRLTWGWSTCIKLTPGTLKKKKRRVGDGRGYWYHRQTADVKVGDWHWNSLPLMVHGRHLHNITLFLGTFSQANLQNTNYLSALHASDI